MMNSSTDGHVKVCPSGVKADIQEENLTVTTDIQRRMLSFKIRRKATQVYIKSNRRYSFYLFFRMLA